MSTQEIERRVRELKEEFKNGNGFGEPITLVAATKMQSAESVNVAITAGVDAVAENKAQEFRGKDAFVLPCARHFIGHLQTNKVKYLVGNVQLFHSCDRDDLANEIARLSLSKGIRSNILLQVNIGDESSKGGYAYAEAQSAFERLSQRQGLRVQGFMAMLPNLDDEALLRGLTRKMRRLYEWSKTQSDDVQYLSMGMSNDYKLCLEEGSNTVRLGSTIFGARI